MLKPDIWIIADPKAGTIAQAVGLAERLGGASRIIEAVGRFPWRYLPARLWWNPRKALTVSLDGPPPNLVIAAGRSAVAPAAALRGPNTRVVALLDPRMDPEKFDLVICPQHDRLRGRNVLTTIGALHKVTPERIAADQATAAFRTADLPRPLIAVLVGGSNGRVRLNAAKLGQELAALAQKTGGSLAVSTSRRTGEAATAILRHALTDVPHDFYSGDGDNPYPGILAIADHILVTEDSVSMLSEAASTGKPVHILRLEGNPGKFRFFQEALITGRHARYFDGELPHWTAPVLDETQRAAEAVVGLLIGEQNPHLPEVPAEVSRRP
ncbi:mitochondrial fission ELM1 family protein [Lacibacterium aquatile]|uniref:Mitochondrial fission ELM1 family protein n=1 Tax=Lacibacterium aquatile TaxID=1168082 RepID=A0ABW5DWI9_9PROT